LPGRADAEALNEESNPPWYMIHWSKEFETGSAMLDLQHRALIDNINLLKEQLDHPLFSRGDLEYAMSLVNYLETYANIHFNAEEKCMERHRCPAHAKNQEEHERFRGFIRDYRKLCQIEGFSAELLKSLHGTVRSWIEEHILKVDTQLRSCIPPSVPGAASAAPE
jgi:hemerythrin